MKRFIINDVIFEDGVIATQILLNDLMINTLGLLVPEEYKHLKIKDIEYKDLFDTCSCGKELLYEYAKFVELIESCKTEMVREQTLFVKLQIEALEENLVTLRENNEYNQKVSEMHRNNIFGFIKTNKDIIKEFDKVQKNSYARGKEAIDTTLGYYKSLNLYNLKLSLYEDKKNEVLKKIQKWNALQYDNAKSAITTS